MQTFHFGRTLHRGLDLLDAVGVGARVAVGARPVGHEVDAEARLQLSRIGLVGQHLAAAERPGISRTEWTR
jgi:hypothetical protein